MECNNNALGSLVSLPNGKEIWILSDSRSAMQHLSNWQRCKSFEMCSNCSSEPAHVLECLGLTKQDLADDPLLVMDFLKVYDVMDLV
ncbi:UNVERIFIED_CONTAM: hypothetical protein NCL1_20861 [Trichonephila clavipes]